MIEIRTVTDENLDALNLKNDPFEMPGRLIPSLQDGIWQYREELYEKPQVMCFPDEQYDWERYRKDGVVLSAYLDTCCVGLAICRDSFWKYMYLYELKVSADARGKGIGRKLVEVAMEEARMRGYRGLYLQAQDTNLNACRFYLKNGFRIGGFDNHVYEGTGQAGKADVYFYRW